MRLFLERFEEIAVSAEAVLTGDGVLERNLLQRHKSESHIGTEEDKATERGEVGNPVGNRSKIDDTKESELREDNRDEEGEDI